MSVNYNYKKGIDTPTWEWLAPFPGGSSNPGTSNVYDGSRYFYWTVQFGTTTAGTVSTTQLWRYDTWSNGWQYLTGLTNSNQGIDMEFDSIRNVVYISNGSAATWQVFNLNTTSVTLCGVACAPWVATTLTPILPGSAGIGTSLTMPSDDQVPAQIDSGTADVTGNTTTNVQANAATGTFGGGMVGLQLRVTSGAQSGQIRSIASVTAPTLLTLATALPAALAAGDTFVIELIAKPATATTTTTVTDSTANWIVNAYANMDVILTSGALSGQRRRIASNTATVLTLATAVTGNARTGPFSAAPGATDSFKIVPSSDFLYYQAGNATSNLYRIDVVANPAATWTTLLASPGTISGGGNTFYPTAYAPYRLISVRGGGTAGLYLYDIGTNTWTTPNVFPGQETFNTGANTAMIKGKRKILIQIQGSTRLYIYDLLTGLFEPAGTQPYAAGAAYDGKRMRVMSTPDGAMFAYVMRASGQEHFRVALEWL